MNETRPPVPRGFGEPQDLRQVQRAKLTNFAALIGLILMMGLTFYFMTSLSGAKSELQRSKALLQEHADSLADMQARQVKLISELNSYKDAMAEREKKAWLVVDSLAKTIKERDYAGAQDIADDYAETGPDSRPHSHDNPSVNLYFYQAPKELQVSVRNYIERQNFKVLAEEQMSELSKWLMDYSIVEYYDKEMSAAATKIAQELTENTKTKFVPTHSPDLQMDSHLHWINIVVVGASASEAIRQTNAPYMQMRMERGK